MECPRGLDGKSTVLIKSVKASFEIFEDKKLGINKVKVGQDIQA